jgi:Helix-turn-helix domain
MSIENSKEPVISAAEKFKWMMAISADPVLSSSHKLVCIRIILHANAWTGECFVSAEKLAEECNVSVSTVRGAFTAGVLGGWLKISYRKGGRHGNQGLANVFEHSWPRDLPTQNLHPNPVDDDVRLQNSAPTLQNEGTYPAKNGDLPTQNLQPNSSSNSSPNSSSNRVENLGEAGELATALVEGALARPPTKPATDQELYWRTLQKEFGLEHVRFNRIAGGTVYLVARPSEATEIEQPLGESLLAYWRLFRPNVTRVRVLPLGEDADEAAPQQAAAGAT